MLNRFARPTIVITGLIIGHGFAAAQDRLKTSDTVLAGGSHDFTVTNRSTVALTCLTVGVYRHVRGESAGHWGRGIYDSLLNVPQPSLMEGQSYTWHLGNDTDDLQPMKIVIQAAIFADGIAIGDPAVIRSAWAKRKWFAIGYQEVFHHLDTDVPDINDTDEAVRILKQFESERIGPSTPAEEQVPIRMAYHNVIGNLPNGSASIAEVRADAMKRIKAIHDQIEPAQVKEQNVTGAPTTNQ